MASEPLPSLSISNNLRFAFLPTTRAGKSILSGLFSSEVRFLVSDSAFLCYFPYVSVREIP
jgi:hypothetical protein